MIFNYLFIALILFLFRLHLKRSYVLREESINENNFNFNFCRASYILEIAHILVLWTWISMKTCGLI